MWFYVRLISALQRVNIQRRALAVLLAQWYLGALEALDSVWFASQLSDVRLEGLP